MPTAREEIKKNHRLARMRLGQDAPERVQIPSMPGIGCVQVPLTERETQAGLISAAALEVVDNQAGLAARDRAAACSDVWHSLREPSDPETHVFESVDDMLEQLDPGDIDYLFDHLITLSEFASPAADGITEEELDDLKKVFARTDWSELTGRRWAAVKLCCSILSPELLQAKLLGSGSTDSLTPTRENVVST